MSMRFVPISVGTTGMQRMGKAAWHSYKRRKGSVTQLEEYRSFKSGVGGSKPSWPKGESMIYVTGDVHGQIDVRKLNSTNFPVGTLLSKDDYVIVAGDFGFLWTNPDKTERYWLDWLEEKPWTTLFVDGNHENHDRLNRLPVEDKFNSKVGVVNDSIFHLKRGEVYEINGRSIFTFGGAYSIDKGQRIENISWWSGELPNWAQYENGMTNLKAHKWTVDYIITHEAPMSIVMQLISLDGKDPYYDLPKYFDELSKRVSFRHWYFGHYHIDKRVNSKYTALYHEIVKLGS